jgi:hypothetical protein
LLGGGLRGGIERDGERQGCCGCRNEDCSHWGARLRKFSSFIQRRGRQRGGQWYVWLMCLKGEGPHRGGVEIAERFKGEEGVQRGCFISCARIRSTKSSEAWDILQTPGLLRRARTCRKLNLAWTRRVARERNLRRGPRGNVRRLTCRPHSWAEHIIAHRMFGPGPRPRTITRQIP